jgi:predicted regulator of Ras-like GTPase activity (Roadblock/LC7/MglB family)
MFRASLRDIVEKTDGGVAGLIMDSEGIPVETYAREGAGIDIATVGVEFGVVLAAVRRAVESLDAGSAREVSIMTDGLVTLIRTLGDAYFLAVAMRPDGNIGKGRFLMRTAMPALLAELG